MGYAAMVVALTWPLAPRATTHIAATHGLFHIDTLHTAWMLAHESRALTDASTSLLDAGIYHPDRRTLFYSTTSLGLLPFFAPTFLATGNPVLAIDVAFLACVALTAWTMHVVVHRWTGDHLAAAFAGLAYLVSTTPIRGFPSAAPYFAVLMYVPLVIYAAAMPTSWLAAPPLLAVLIALQCLTEPLYVAPVVLVPLVTIALARLTRASTRGAGLRLAITLALAAVVLLPVYVGYADVLLRNPNLSHQTVYGIRDAPSSSGGSRPSLAFSLYAYVVGSWYWYPIPAVALATIVVGFAAARRWATPSERAAWRHCALWSVLVFVLPMLRQWFRCCVGCTAPGSSTWCRSGCSRVSPSPRARPGWPLATDGAPHGSSPLGYSSCSSRGHTAQCRSAGSTSSEATRRSPRPIPRRLSSRRSVRAVDPSSRYPWDAPNTTRSRSTARSSTAVRW
jgi:hypothetical protein